MIGERTNANGSKRSVTHDRRGLPKCLDIAKDQTRDGAHLLDCAWTTWAGTAWPT